MAGSYLTGEQVLSNPEQIGYDVWDGIFAQGGFSGGEGWNNGGPSWSGSIEGENGPSRDYTPTPEAMNWLNNSGLKFQWNPTGNGAEGNLNIYNPSGQLQDTIKQKSGNDPFASLALGLALGPLAPGLAGMFGGGLMGSTAAGSVLGGVGSAAQGGSFTDGLLSGALGGAIGNFNPAAKLGIDNSVLAKGVNGVISGTASGLAKGQDFGDALKGSAMSAGVGMGSTAMNQYFGDLFDKYTATSTSPENLSSNPAMNASYGADYKPPGIEALQSAGIGPEMSYAPPNSDANSFNILNLNNSLQPSDGMKTAQGFSLPTMQQLGGFAANNAGGLAQMLYGIYNNRKQQNALKGQMGALQGLFGQNSPYATQLRNTLAAKAAQQGKRSNSSARETQLQALLAEKAASMSPQMFNLQNAQGQLQNGMMNNIFSSLRNMNGLGSLFGLGG